MSSLRKRNDRIFQQAKKRTKRAADVLKENFLARAIKLMVIVIQDYIESFVEFTQDATATAIKQQKESIKIVALKCVKIGTTTIRILKNGQ